MDRSVDLVTPLCTQLTYEGLVDEIMTITNGAAPPLLPPTLHLYLSLEEHFMGSGEASVRGAGEIGSFD